MNKHDFLSLFVSSEREWIEKELDAGVSWAVIASIPVLFIGNLPDEKGILITSLGPADIHGVKEMYVSSLEAALEGRAIIVFAECYGPMSVLKGAEDGNGRLYSIVTDPQVVLKCRYSPVIRRILLSGGGIIMPLVPPKRKGAMYLSSFLSEEALVLVGGEYIPDYSPVITMLDMGKDVSILRSSLSSRAGRRLAGEGCPVMSSYSSLPGRGKFIVYHSESGRYGFLGENYDALRLC